MNKSLVTLFTVGLLCFDVYPKDFSFKESYVVQKGDSLFKILKRHSSKTNPWTLVYNFKILNPRVKNINKIFEGESLRLPIATSYRSLASVKKTAKSNFLLDEQIYYLNSSTAQSYVLIYRDIVASNEELEIAKALDALVDLASQNNHDYLLREFISFSELIKSEASSSEYLEVVKDFFENWKNLRDQKNNGAGR